MRFPYGNDRLPTASIVCLYSLLRFDVKKFSKRSRLVKPNSRATNRTSLIPKLDDVIALLKEKKMFLKISSDLFREIIMCLMIEAAKNVDTHLLLEAVTKLLA